MSVSRDQMLQILKAAQKLKEDNNRLIAENHQIKEDIISLKQQVENIKSTDKEVINKQDIDEKLKAYINEIDACLSLIQKISI